MLSSPISIDNFEVVRHLLLLFLADPAVKTLSRVALTPIAHNDFPGAHLPPVSHTLVQIGDIACTHAGHRVQCEQQLLGDDAFNRIGIRVPTAADLVTQLTRDPALALGLPLIDPTDPGKDVRCWHGCL